MRRPAVASYMRRLLWMLAGWLCVSPVGCILSDLSAPGRPVLWLTLAPLPALLLLPLVRRTRRRRTLLLRLLPALLIGLGVFWVWPLAFRMASTLYLVLLLTLLDQVNQGREEALLLASGSLLLLDLLLAFLSFWGVVSDARLALYQPWLYLSVLSAVGLLVFSGVDRARSFGPKRLTIPRATRGLVLLVLGALAALAALFALSPLLAEGAARLMEGLRVLLVAVMAFLNRLLTPTGPLEGEPGDIGGGMPEMPEAAGGGTPEWLAQLLTVLVLTALTVLVLVVLARLVRRLWRVVTAWLAATVAQDDVLYIEETERLSSRSRPQRGVRRVSRSTAATERERIRRLYRDYVARARRAGLTQDAAFATPRAVLEEIGENRADSSRLPPPGTLREDYEAARYDDRGRSADGRCPAQPGRAQGREQAAMLRHRGPERRPKA